MYFKKASSLNKNQIRLILGVLLLLSIKASLQAQGTGESQELSLKQENPKSSMWGQIGKQVLPFFQVNDENFEYPVEAMMNRTQGQVDVSFKVNMEGEVIDSTVQIINSLSKALDEKALEMVQNTQLRNQWPFFQQSYNTETRYYTTLVFAIQEKHWASFYRKIGLSAYKKLNYQEAIRNFNLSVQFDDKNAATYYSLYRSYSEINEKKLACDCLKKAKRHKRGYSYEWKSQCR